MQIARHFRALRSMDGHGIGEGDEQPISMGRLNAAVLMLSQGAMAAGGIVWGAAAEGFGTRTTLLAVGGLFVASLALARRWSLDPLDLDWT